MRQISHIPKVEDLFVKLTGGCIFTKIDLSQAYLQLPLDESKTFIVINTHKGSFRYTQLPFGISVAPGIFQRVMDNILQGILGIMVYLDDILITGPTVSEHLQSLETVLERLAKAGLHIKKNKCTIMSSSVIYLGHKVRFTPPTRQSTCYCGNTLPIKSQTVEVLPWFNHLLCQVLTKLVIALISITQTVTQRHYMAMGRQ